MILLWLVTVPGFWTLVLYIIGFFVVLLLSLWLISIAMLKLSEFWGHFKEDLRSSREANRDRRAVVRYSRPKPARRIMQLSETAKFTLAASQLQSALARQAHSEALAGILSLETILAPYKAAGQLPPELEAELERFLTRNTAAFASLSDDVGRALAALIKAYVPPKYRLQYFWRTKRQPLLTQSAR